MRILFENMFYFFTLYCFKMSIEYFYLVQNHKFNLGDSVVGKGADLFKATKLALYLSPAIYYITIHLIIILLDFRDKNPRF